MSLRWIRRQAGSYEASIGCAKYFVIQGDVPGNARQWEVMYPDGEVSEPADTLAEAKAWAEADAERLAS